MIENQMLCINTGQYIINKIKKKLEIRDRILLTTMLKVTYKKEMVKKLTQLIK